MPRMPELPEVEVVARGLARHLAGQRIAGLAWARRDIVRGGHIELLDRLTGRAILSAQREGKAIRISLDGHIRIVVHLGMTGRLLVTPPDSPDEPHTHLRIDLAPCGRQLRYCDPRRFGGIWVVDERRLQAGGPIQGRRLPPVAADPLTMSWPDWRRALARGRQIKALLMAQEPISGMGNIYCDEALHRAGIHPLRPANTLSPEEARRLRTAVQRVLREAIRAGGSSISDYRDADNVRGSFQKRHRVYNRTGEPCRSCGTPIERLVVGGRSTHICPACQQLSGGRARRAVVEMRRSFQRT
jgi:formamidopyrimidine-DNA glycosylase